MTFAGEFSDEDWDHSLGGWHVVAEERGSVVAHASVVPRNIHVAGRSLETGYVEAVATLPARQQQGLGSAVMAAAGNIIQERFELGALSTGSHAFYSRLGWERWRGPTYVRNGVELIRTPDDDDGIMILRTPTTGEIDLSAPISCEARRGDDW